MSRGGNGAVAEERSSAKAVEEIATNPITAKRALLTMRTSIFLLDACSHGYSGVPLASAHHCGEGHDYAATVGTTLPAGGFMMLSNTGNI